MTGPLDLDGFVPQFTGPVSIDTLRGGTPVSSRFGLPGAWGLPATGVVPDRDLRPDPADARDWRDPRVGWGIVLPERPGLDAAQLAVADDAPEPIRELVRVRGGKVLRYKAGSPARRWTLRCYATPEDLTLATSPPGTGPGELPAYLLIFGGPDEIPWEVQYVLNSSRAVGRLDLAGPALENYAGALITGWPDSAARYRAPVVWSVDLAAGAGDITGLMRRTIGEPIHRRFADDGDMPDASYIDGSVTAATSSALIEAVARNRPALVVTTGHGRTEPTGDPAGLAAELGLLLDSTGRPVNGDDLLRAWSPDGAIWMAQACCSAGSNSPSSYADLFAPTDPVGEVLHGVAALGSVVAPLPQLLLGASKPLRAFIGRVEPTFNWTLEFPPSRQALTADLLTALYTNLCDEIPVGLALEPFFRPIGGLLQAQSAERTAYNAGQFAGTMNMAQYYKVCALDRAGLVVLGDPTVALPAPPRTP